MTPSTTQLLLRIALALLLPLWARSTTQDEVYAVFLMEVLLTILVYDTRYTVAFSLIIRVLVALCGTFIASYVTDYAVGGPWMRLGMTYVFSWDALWCFFPHTEHHVCVCAARQQSVRYPPVLILPLVLAVVLTIYLGVCEYLNTQGSKWRAVCIGSLVLYAVGDILQHIAIDIRHVVTKKVTASRSDEDVTPESVKLESK